MCACVCVRACACACVCERARAVVRVCVDVCVNKLSALGRKVKRVGPNRTWCHDAPIQAVQHVLKNRNIPVSATGLGVTGLAIAFLYPSAPMS